MSAMWYGYTAFGIFCWSIIADSVRLTRRVVLVSAIVAVAWPLTLCLVMAIATFAVAVRYHWLREIRRREGA